MNHSHHGKHTHMSNVIDPKIPVLSLVTKLTLVTVHEDATYDAAPGESVNVFLDDHKTLIVNLPDASTCIGAPVEVKRVGAGGIVTVTSPPSVGDTIDGETSVDLGVDGHGGNEGIVLRAICAGQYIVLARTGS